MDKRIDILLSQADFFKLTFLALYGVFGLEWLSGLEDPAKIDPYKLVGGFVLGSFAGLAMMVCWWKAKRLTESTKK